MGPQECLSLSSKKNPLKLLKQLSEEPCKGICQQALKALTAAAKGPISNHIIVSLVIFYCFPLTKA